MSEKAAVTEMPLKSIRDRIFAHPRPKGKTLEVSEWDVTVELRSMSIEQKGNLIGDENLKPSKFTQMLPEVIIFTCYEPGTDKPIFTADDLGKLKDEPASLIERVATEGLNVSGIGEDAGDEGKDDS